MENTYDLVIVGSGILGTSLSYWTSLLYEGRVLVIEMAGDAAVHTSGRNTGVIHRPFYLNPERRKVFALCSQISYGLWKKSARENNLPWSEHGTIEVAVKPEEVVIVRKYVKWALQNGMKESEIAFLTGEEVRKIEPDVECAGAIFAKTDTSVDFKVFTRFLKEEAARQGATFLFNHKLSRVEKKGGMLELSIEGQNGTIQTPYLVNCAGGNSVDVAHQMGLGLEYTDLHFRGEYWEVDPGAYKRIKSNIYSVPRHPELPFLDPHWIVRADGRREIGPNAVMVTGCETYSGFFSSPAELVAKIFERPMMNKLNLFTNPDFLRLASEEWVSSISKGQMVKRVQKFIPSLKESELKKPGTAGIRSSVIDQKGNFMKEAIELADERSFHIINYNSPGATGSPAYTAILLQKLLKRGYLSGLKRRQKALPGIWNFDEVKAELDRAGEKY